jgi:serine/threonine-protein kinase
MCGVTGSGAVDAILRPSVSVSVSSLEWSSFRVADKAADGSIVRHRINVAFCGHRSNVAFGDEGLVLPRQIGPYEVRKIVGRGAAASVYECFHAKLRRVVAVKVLHPHLARDKVAAIRFLREGRALSRIAHPNVVEVLDVGEDNGMPYLVMAFVDGEDLRAHLRRPGPMSVVAIADCLLPVISGVAAAHEAGIVHRDLKPSNICLACDHRGKPSPKVLDFGISKVTGEDQTDLTDTSGALGTAYYMAPEQLRSAKRADARSDIYSLGVILYECATGKRPFSGMSGYDLMHAILTAPVLPPSALRRDLPEAFDAVVLRAMQREPSKRFASARALGRALAPLASEPTKWADEFAPRAADAAAIEGPATTESGEQVFTLISALNKPARSRGVHVAIALATGVACAGLVGAMTVREQSNKSSPKAHSVSSGHPQVVSSAAPLLGSASAKPPELEQSEDALPPMPQAAGTVIEPRSGPAQSVHLRAPTVPRPSVITRTEPPKAEIGTNSAPILE